MKKAASFWDRFLLGVFVAALFVLLAPSAMAREERFFVDASRDMNDRNEVRAEHLFDTTHTQVWVEEKYWEGLDEEARVAQQRQVAVLAAAFDEHIYEGVRGLLGEERSPGLDGTSRISVLITPMRAGEYAYARPFIDGTRRKNSNEGEVIFIPTDSGAGQRAKAALASSFASLVVYNERVLERGIAEEPWVVAMLASYAPTYLGYDAPFFDSQLRAQMYRFLDNPNNSFLQWDGGADDWASASLFIHFLQGYYGDRVIPALLRTPSAGTAGVSASLRAIGYQTTFADALEAWAIASYVNGEVAGESEGYAYTHPSLGVGSVRVSPDYRAPIGEGYASISRFGMEPASAQWVRYTPASLGSNGLNTLNLHIQRPGAGTTRLALIETAIDGTTRLRLVPLSEGRAEVSVDLFGNYVLSVVLIAINPTAENTLLSVEAFSRESDRTNPAGALPDGSLIREVGRDRIYVVTGSSRRWIQSPEIMNAYAHLRWEDVREVPSSTLAWYRESFLVRRFGREEVYEADEQGGLAWLDMSARAFERAGYRWEDVFVINEREFVWYADAQE